MNIHVISFDIWTGCSVNVKLKGGCIVTTAIYHWLKMVDLHKNYCMYDTAAICELPSLPGECSPGANWTHIPINSRVPEI
jgi:hypothetical protein